MMTDDARKRSDTELNLDTCFTRLHRQFPRRRHRDTLSCPCLNFSYRCNQVANRIELDTSMLSKHMYQWNTDVARSRAEPQLPIGNLNQSSRSGPTARNSRASPRPKKNFSVTVPPPHIRRNHAVLFFPHKCLPSSKDAFDRVPRLQFPSISSISATDILASLHHQKPQGLSIPLRILFLCSRFRFRVCRTVSSASILARLDPDDVESTCIEP